MAVSSPLMMAMYLSIGFLYAGFGFLLKGMQIQPYSGVASFVVALLPQLYIARRYIGRARKPTGKSKKLRNWTANTVFSRFLPVIMSCSIVAGLMGASGVAGVQQVAFAKVSKTTFSKNKKPRTKRWSLLEFSKENSLFLAISLFGCGIPFLTTQLHDDVLGTRDERGFVLKVII